MLAGAAQSMKNVSSGAKWKVTRVLSKAAPDVHRRCKINENMSSGARMKITRVLTRAAPDVRRSCKINKSMKM